jgi:TolB-like protein/Tfp pilus assembly protein PilF
LPFKPLEEVNGDQLLGIGMADAIITRLSHLKELSVIPTSSVFKYAGQDSDAAVVGRELGVDAILTGTLQRSGDHIRINVQMVGLQDGKTLWSDRFDERFTDIFALQDSISEEIAHSLRAKIGSEDRFATSHPANTEAYQSYLMGLYFWNKRSKEGLKKAAEYFQDATDKDPNYSIAFAGLADTYCLLDYYYYESQRSKELNEKAKRFAQRSLDLDESLAEGHMAMAFIQSRYENDCVAAEQSYRRALYLNPSYATAHQRYGWLLIRSGRLDEALREMKKAQQLDPLSPTINGALGQVLTYSHQYDESIRYCRRALELDPNNDVLHSSLGRTYELKGMYPVAIAEFEKAKQIDDHQGEVTASLGHAFAQAGQTVMAERMLHSLRHTGKPDNVSHYGLALILSALGKRTLAVKELAMAMTHVDFNTGLEIKYDPRLDPLRHDSNFNQLLKDHNLAG